MSSRGPARAPTTDYYRSERSTPREERHRARLMQTAGYLVDGYGYLVDERYLLPLAALLIEALEARRRRRSAA